MARRVRLNRAGVSEMLKSAGMRKAVEDEADRVADAVRAQGIRVEGLPGDVALPVEVESTVTDRARSVVLIPHAAGLAVQAKHGVLTKAASAAGLQVKSR